MKTRAVSSHSLLYGLALSGFLLATAAEAAGTLKVMRQGLGDGAVASLDMNSSINCGASPCTETFSGSPTVTLQAIADGLSVFVGWRGDCVTPPMTMPSANCVVAMSQDRSVRAEFRLIADPGATTLPMNPSVADIETFLTNFPNAKTPGAFLRALDPAYKQGWILMTRSESLQTGTAQFPRVMLPSTDARSVFTIGLSVHDSYPGADPKAIEFMQWDPAGKTFRFHEIVLDDINAVNQPVPVTPAAPMGSVEIFPFRARGVYPDAPRCTRCHSTRNIPNSNPAQRGTAVPSGSPSAKNKPNWDTYDSWGGAMPFNRDRIYQGSLEASAFRKLLNPWSWRDNPVARRVMEQLELQPSGVVGNDIITRVAGGARDATPVFFFDGGTPPATEPAPVGGVGEPNVNVNYSFDNVDSSAVGSAVIRSGQRVTLHEVLTPTSGEGRGVQLFDRLAGADSHFNQIRVGHEIASHRFATGGVPIDVRPVALAIVKGCFRINTMLSRVESVLPVTPTNPVLTVDQSFFAGRHRLALAAGMGLNDLFDDTRARTVSLPVRKANIEKLNQDRAGDVYLLNPAAVADIDLIERYGAGTSQGTSAAVERLRQEIFRRSIDAPSADSSTQLEGKYVDREDYNNTNMMTLFRFFLEPLGVSVDKWSMSVRGRSRTYSFADVFSTYVTEITNELEASLNTPGDGYPGLTTFDCVSLINATNSSLSALPTLVPPTFTDVQRVFNKGCIECHGGLGYPPFTKFMPVNSIDFSEEDNPASGDRLLRSFDFAHGLTSNAFDASNRIWTRITASGENCGDFVSVMPCGGPPLTGPDIDTIKRWITGGASNTHGDPHIHTIDGTDYDFQSVGEFTLLRGEAFEIQARQAPVQGATPLAPNAHSGLTTCPAINTAAAIRLGGHRVTYQPNLSGQPDPNGMQLRIDGQLVEKLGARGINLAGGGRILPTTAPGGIQIEYPGGTDVVLTPNWWSHYQLWYLDIDVRYGRGNFGVMGVIAPRNWLPALPDNSFLGPQPPALLDRYAALYGKFADAWRVNKASTLFDYAPGTSSATFTLKGWPKHEPKDCWLPSGWAPKVEPQKPISIDEAKKICSAVINPADRDKCTQDVAVTGEAGFAKVYVEGERIQRNILPKAPALEYPKDMDLGLPDTVDFAWSPAKDKDGGTLTYKHCVWIAGEKLDYGKHCKDLPPQVYFATAGGLQKDSLYYWKVVVDDAQGGTVNSEIRRFRTK